MSVLTDEQLIEKVCMNSRPAFEELYRRYAGRIRYFFLQLSAYDTDYAADNTHDVFLKVLETCHSFHSTAKFSTWIFSLAYNRHKNNLRHRDVCKRFENSFSSQELIYNPEIENSLDKDSRIKLVRKMLSILDDEARILFHLRFVDGMSIPQMASIC